MDSSSLLPATPYERDPTIDYNLHKAALYTMATCHSLRVLDKGLIGDPLDLKMFEFTGWSFEEGEHDGLDDTKQSRLTPSVARPPPGKEFGTDDDGPTVKVGLNRRMMGLD